jgi:hypothetical protein
MRDIIILEHTVYFVEAQGRLVKAEFTTINDLSDEEYLDLDKTNVDIKQGA